MAISDLLSGQLEAANTGIVDPTVKRVEYYTFEPTSGQVALDVFKAAIARMLEARDEALKQMGAPDPSAQGGFAEFMKDIEKSRTGVEGKSNCLVSLVDAANNRIRGYRSGTISISGPDAAALKVAVDWKAIGYALRK